MSKTASGALAVLAAIVLVVAYSALFTVHQNQQAIVLRFGEPVKFALEPGLYTKYPVIDAVVYIDRRILDLENPAQEVIASDQKRLVVDAFARYKVSDPLRFYQTLGSVERANSQLGTLLNSALRRVLGEATFIQIVRDEREGLMGKIREQMTREGQNFGIAVVDVRIRRADLPDANSQAVFQRMQTQIQREAAEIRAGGNQLAQTIRAKADREVTVTVAEAQSRGEQIRGEGDATRNRIYADAYNQDRDFFSFYRSMQAYEQAMKRNDTNLVLTPDSDFMRYFNDAAGKPAAPAPR